MRHTPALELENQTKIDHAGDYCTLSTSIKYDGGILQVNQRIHDTPEGYRDGQYRVSCILRAVNSHAALLEALKSVNDRIDDYLLNNNPFHLLAAQEIIKQALKQAEGGA